MSTREEVIAHPAFLFADQVFWSRDGRTRTETPRAFAQQCGADERFSEVLVALYDRIAMIKANAGVQPASRGTYRALVALLSANRDRGVEANMAAFARGFADIVRHTMTAVRQADATQKLTLLCAHDLKVAALDSYYWMKLLSEFETSGRWPELNSFIHRPAEGFLLALLELELELELELPAWAAPRSDHGAEVEAVGDRQSIGETDLEDPKTWLPQLQDSSSPSVPPNGGRNWRDPGGADYKLPS